MLITVKTRSRKRPSIKIAFVIGDGITLLDFAGVFDPLTRLKTMGFHNNLPWDLCARTSAVRSTEGVVFTPDTWSVMIWQNTIT